MRSRPLKPEEDSAEDLIGEADQESSQDRKSPERTVYQAAMDLLARREHSSFELLNKLKTRGYGQEECEQMIEKLIANNLQSDARFIESYVNSRLHRGIGPLKLVAELRQRGIDDGPAHAYLDERSIDWFAHARAVYEKKYAGSPDGDGREQAKRARFLQSKGFPSDIIREILWTD